MKFAPAVRAHRPVTFREVDSEIWRCYFTVLRSILLVITSVVYLVTLIVYFFTQFMFLGAEASLRYVAAWDPKRPEIFKLGEKGEKDVGTTL